MIFLYCFFQCQTLVSVLWWGLMLVVSSSQLFSLLTILTLFIIDHYLLSHCSCTYHSKQFMDLFKYHRCTKTCIQTSPTRLDRHYWEWQPAWMKGSATSLNISKMRVYGMTLLSYFLPVSFHEVIILLRLYCSQMEFMLEVQLNNWDI